MVIYFFQFILVSLSSYIYSKCKTLESCVLSLIITFMIMFIPASIRYGTGKDYFNYINIFYGSANSTFSLYDISRVELGYVWLNKTLYNFGFGYQWIFVIMSFLTLFFLIISTKKKYAFIIIPFYFLLQYIWSLNVMRQALTVTMGFYAYTQFNSKRYVKSIFIMLLAFFFHKSAIIYPVLFLFAKIFKLTKTQSFVLVIIIFSISSQLGRIALYFADIILPSFSSTYARHIANDVEGGKVAGIGTWLRYFSYLLLLIFIPDRKDNNISTLTLLLIIIFLDVMAMFSFYIVIRLTYGLSFVIFLAAKEVIISKNKWRNIVVLMVLLITLFNFSLSRFRLQNREAERYQTVPGIEYFYSRN